MRPGLEKAGTKKGGVCCFSLMGAPVAFCLDIVPLGPSCRSAAAARRFRRTTAPPRVGLLRKSGGGGLFGRGPPATFIKVAGDRKGFVTTRRPRRVSRLFASWQTERMRTQAPPAAVGPKAVGKHARKLGCVLALWVAGHRVSLGREPPRAGVGGSRFGRRKGGRGLMRPKAFVLETLVAANRQGQTTGFAFAPIDGKGRKRLGGLAKKNTPRETLRLRECPERGTMVGANNMGPRVPTPSLRKHCLKIDPNGRRGVLIRGRLSSGRPVRG